MTRRGPHHRENMTEFRDGSSYGNQLKERNCDWEMSSSKRTTTESRKFGIKIEKLK